MSDLQSAKATVRAYMAWYGPAAIGSTDTIERYIEQHQQPSRRQLAQNWVIIDMLHFLKMQGYDVSERFRTLNS